MKEPSLNLNALRNAVASLEGGIGVVRNTAWFDQLRSIVQDMLIAGVIQHFEFVYELSTKMIRRRIELDSDSPDDVDVTSFRDIYPVSFGIWVSF